MNVKDFEYVAAIAEQESISKAAASLYLSQPTLSKFLQKIEAEFEIPLFYRVGKRMIPTPAGVVCVEKAKQIIDLNEQMNHQILSVRQQEHGYLRIGTSASRGEFFVTQILTGMRKAYPKTRFSLTLSAKNDLLQQLEQGELDIVFTSNSSERSYLKYINIVEEEMVLVVPAGHELEKLAVWRTGFSYPYVERRDWIAYPYILADIKMNTGQYARMLFDHYQQSPPIALEIASMQHIYSAVSKKIGITIAPNMPQFQAEHQSLRYLSFEDDRNIQWHFTAIMKSQTPELPITEKLIQLVKEYYKPVG